MKYIKNSAISTALPRFDELRRRFMAANTTGWIDGREFLKAAFADVDPDTGAVEITVYAEGDAMEARHYHSADNAETVVDITAQIEDAISGARRGDYRYDSSAFRAAIIREIRDAINNR